MDQAEKKKKILDKVVEIMGNQLFGRYTYYCNQNTIEGDKDALAIHREWFVEGEYPLADNEISYVMRLKEE